MFSISTLPVRSARLSSSTITSSMAVPSTFSARLLSTQAPVSSSSWPASFIRRLPKHKLARQTLSPAQTPLFTTSFQLCKGSRTISSCSVRRCTTTTSPLSLSLSARSRTYSTAASASSSSSAVTPLTWNRFLALRKTRRRISLGSSVICAVIVLGTGISAIMASDFDSTAAATFGIDPVAVLGLSSAGLIAVGWLLGPAFGNTIFGVVYRGHKSAIEAKEREFFTRIKRHRVDPANSSITNPVPDYYGEKIGSVSDYRRWLKDQRAYNLKRGKNV